MHAFQEDRSVLGSDSVTCNPGLDRPMLTPKLALPDKIRINPQTDLGPTQPAQAQNTDCRLAAEKKNSNHWVILFPALRMLHINSLDDLAV